MTGKKADVLPVVHVEIVGIRPLLQDRFPNPDETLKKGTKKADNRTPEERLLEKIHFTKNGDVFIRAEAIEKCIHSGAHRIMMKGRTSWRRTFETGLMVEPLEPLLIVDGGTVVNKQNLASHAELFGVKAMNRQTNPPTAIWSERAMFPEWGVRFTVEILNPVIELEVLKEAVVQAGKFDTLGAWRTNPRYGRFDLASFEVQ